jgi:hypothetical protein
MKLSVHCTHRLLPTVGQRQLSVLWPVHPPGGGGGQYYQCHSFFYRAILRIAAISAAVVALYWVAVLTFLFAQHVDIYTAAKRFVYFYFFPHMATLIN